MNRKLWGLVIALIVVAIVGFKFFTSKTSGVSGLKVISDPATSIFLNDKLIGKTPYEDKHPPGEYILKLIPEGSSPATSWQGKIVLNPLVQTYINRELGVSELTSAGEVMMLEKISQSVSQLGILSQPDGAAVILDGVERGTTPVTINDVSAGEHEVAVSSPGFKTRTVRVSVTSGYKLLVNFQLALAEGSELPASQLTGTPEAKDKKDGRPLVLIKDTPTGFLRVRVGPSTSATETAQVKPGEKYTFLEEKEGWYRISYEQGKEGWISARYAEKVE